MASSMKTPKRRLAGVPHNAWYAIALSNEVGWAPVGRVALGQRVVVYRRRDGQAVALEDRCVHAPVALSDGRVDGDDLIAPYSGFRYGPDGRVLAVPTQANVPYGAAVAAYPVREDGTFVWIWPGDPNLAALRPTPNTSWLRDDSLATIGDEWTTKASLSLMQDNFADITHLPNVDREVAPPVLDAAPPPLKVQVTETSVSFSREFKPGPISEWQAEVMGVDAAGPYAQLEEGAFVSPGLWVDRWSVDLGKEKGTARFIFTHTLTPIDERSTLHSWRVTRNFALSPAGDGSVGPLMRRYYRRVHGILEGMQALVDADGPDRSDVRVAADAAGSQVRRIMAQLTADELR